MNVHEHEKNHSPIDAVDVRVRGYVELYFSTQKNMLNSNVMLILRPVKKIDVLFGTPHMRCLVTVHLMI